MKCRMCEKVIRMRDKEKHQKRLGLCAKCYEFDKRWVKQGIKYSGLAK